MLQIYSIPAEVKCQELTCETTLITLIDMLYKSVEWSMYIAAIGQGSRLI